MTKFTDGKVTKAITMKVWQDGQWSPSLEKDFFSAGSLHWDMENDTYTVDDVGYLVDQAEDWKNGVGDYQDDQEGEAGHKPEDRGVFIEDA